MVGNPEGTGARGILSTSLDPSDTSTDVCRIRKDKISSYSIRLPGFATPQSFLPGAMSLMGLGSTASSPSANTGTGSSNRSEGGAGEEGWTRACRAVLQVLKRILVVESGEGERGIQPGPFAVGPGRR
jgi:beclin 1